MESEYVVVDAYCVYLEEVLDWLKDVKHVVGVSELEFKTRRVACCDEICVAAPGYRSSDLPPHAVLSST